MPKIKCTHEFFQMDKSDLWNQSGYQLIDPVDIGTKMYLCTLLGPNLEQFKDDDIVDITIDTISKRLHVYKYE